MTDPVIDPDEPTEADIDDDEDTTSETPATDLPEDVPDGHVEE